MLDIKNKGKVYLLEATYRYDNGFRNCVINEVNAFEYEGVDVSQVSRQKVYELHTYTNLDSALEVAHKCGFTGSNDIKHSELSISDDEFRYLNKLVFDTAGIQYDLDNFEPTDTQGWECDGTVTLNNKQYNVSVSWSKQALQNIPMWQQVREEARNQMQLENQMPSENGNKNKISQVNSAFGNIKVESSEQNIPKY